MTVSMRPFAHFECPICKEPLLPAEDRTAYSCLNRHSFDVARQGYVNLLPAQHRSRGIDGDTTDMLQARRSFLDRGSFEPLRALLAEEVRYALSARPPGQTPAVLEVGCGEGYYIGGITEALVAEDALFLGSDLSKPAVRMAAKRYESAAFFVADLNRRLYLRDESVAVLLDVFAPRNPDEFARVLEPGGVALVAIPAPDHMATVSESLGLLEIESDKERRVLERLAEGFELDERRELRFELTLDAEEVRDYVAMGPNRWHDQARPIEGSIQTTASFIVLRFRRWVRRSEGDTT